MLCTKDKNAVRGDHDIPICTEVLHCPAACSYKFRHPIDTITQQCVTVIDNHMFACRWRHCELLDKIFGNYTERIYAKWWSVITVHSRIAEPTVRTKQTEAKALRSQLKNSPPHTAILTFLDTPVGATAGRDLPTNLRVNRWCNHKWVDRFGCNVMLIALEP